MSGNTKLNPRKSFAMANILHRFGIDAQVVWAFRDQFPDGKTAGHAWVRVAWDGVEKDVDAMHTDLRSDALIFKR